MTGDVTDPARARAEYETAMTKADIPKLYWRKTLPECGPTGHNLRRYLQEGDYTEDRATGIGLCLHGRSKMRWTALPVLARELVLLSDRVQYVTMHKLINVVNAGGEDYDILLRCGALCIGQFYDDSVPCRYSSYDLSNVEEFLRHRADNQQRVYLSSVSPIRDAAWYTTELRELIADCTKEFNFGD